MDASTVEVLNRINQRFYRNGGHRFSEARRSPWPGWGRVVETASQRGPVAHVLDVGCGNGRFAAWLAEQLGRFPSYVGIDASAELLAEARRLDWGRWRTADVVEVGWERCLGDTRFDLITVFGLLHHVPGVGTRTRLLRTLAGHLSPRGVLALAIWEFGRHDRFRRKLLDWEDFNRNTEHPVALEQLEPGDHLLPFGEPEGPPRYCHFLDAREIAALLDALSLELLADFRADGRSNDLNRYLLLGAPA